MYLVFMMKQNTTTKSQEVQLLDFLKRNGVLSPNFFCKLNLSGTTCGKVSPKGLENGFCDISYLKKETIEKGKHEGYLSPEELKKIIDEFLNNF